ncbi:MAG: LysR family transcriptional regulator [Candidatus Eremiobacteraeota bacterium]|nr:LysR family transcriptional regulator [Candidatus Eremiobacteraeota bacterium]
MHLAHVEAADLNLLKYSYALLEERHVTRAATNCGLSQPAMSRALDRLRELFDDELLIRKAGAFERTSRANAILADLRTLLPRLEALLRPGSFDPSSSSQRFKLITTDYGSVVFVPNLIATLAEVAPKVRLDVSLWDDKAINAIEVGNVALAVIGRDDVRQFETEAFTPEEFVCLVARDHPISSRRFTLETYVKYPHVSINVARGGQPWIENRLAAEGYERNVALSTPTSASAALAVARTDMICTIGKRMAGALLPLADLRIVAAPRQIGQSHHCMAWHRRSNGDVAQEWFRGCLRAVVESSADG